MLATVLLAGNIATAHAMELADQPEVSPVVLNVVKRAASRGGGWVRIYMRDKRIISGRVMEARGETFVLSLDETGILETFRYVDVKNAKGPPTHPMVKLSVIAGAAAAVYFLLPKLLIPRT